MCYNDQTTPVSEIDCVISRRDGIRIVARLSSNEQQLRGETDLKLFDFAFIARKGFEILEIMLDDENLTASDLHGLIDKKFEAEYAAGRIYYFGIDGQPYASDCDQAVAALFRIDLETSTGGEIWGRFVLNNKDNVDKKWFGIEFVDRTDLYSFIRGTFVIGDLVFPSWQDGLDFLENLSKLAIPEKWHYDTKRSSVNHPILRSYLSHYYFKLLSEGKVLFSGNWAAFNTGLLDEYFSEIFVVCEVDSNSNEYLPRFLKPMVCREDHQLLQKFDKTPETAAFFTDIKEVVFDSSLEIKTNNVHIFEDNYSRLPAELKNFSKQQLHMLLMSAAEFARKLSQRNYKFVVPQYWKKTNSIQFLMPIFLNGKFTGTPDCALVLERQKNYYRGTTILTLDMAYQNARLIAKPDDFWLNP